MEGMGAQRPDNGIDDRASRRPLPLHEIQRDSERWFRQRSGLQRMRARLAESSNHNGKAVRWNGGEIQPRCDRRIDGTKILLTCSKSRVNVDGAVRNRNSDTIENLLTWCKCVSPFESASLGLFTVARSIPRRASATNRHPMAQVVAF